jgi:hypothetical protein
MFHPSTQVLEHFEKHLPSEPRSAEEIWRAGGFYAKQTAKQALTHLARQGKARVTTDLNRWHQERNLYCRVEGRVT